MKYKNQDAIVIALAGKGGVGKTSITALILDELARNGYPGPVLAVDADPASTLHLALGLPAPIATVGHVRDHTPLDAQTVRSLPASVSKTDYVANQLAQAQVLTEHKLRDMPLHCMAMGQSEGPGCYCAINAALSQVLTELMICYSLIVIDSEAGLEHLSRVRVKRVDFLWVVVNPTRASLSVADQILATVREVKMEVGQAGLILNRARADEVRPQRSDILSALPQERAIERLEVLAQPLIELPDDSPVRRKLAFLVQGILR
jgi:CO dehydrogenase maturation factor